MKNILAFAVGGKILKSPSDFEVILFLYYFASEQRLLSSGYLPLRSILPLRFACGPLRLSGKLLPLRSSA